MTTATMPEVQQISPGEIIFADSLTDDGFCNPRHFHQGGEGELSAQGFENQSMEQLCEDIDTRGITNPLLLRKLDNGDLILLAGERRLRCAMKLEKESVPVRIYEGITDDEAWIIAWRDNDTGKPIGDNATAACVRHWRKIGFSDEKILEITGRTKPWLRQMDILGNLDLTTFEEYQNGRLSLRVALKLAAIEEVELRHALLKATLDDLAKDWQAEIGKREKAVTKAEDKVETADANVAAANVMGDDDDKEQASEEAEQAHENLNTAQAALEEAEDTTPQARNKNLNTASTVVGATHVSSSLSKAKIKKILKSLDKWLGNDGHDEDDEFIGEVDHLNLARAIVDSILTGGNQEPIALIKSVFSDYYVEDDADTEETAEQEVDDDEAASAEEVIADYQEEDEVESVVAEDEDYDDDDADYDDDDEESDFV